MQANEFVKNFGLLCAKSVLECSDEHHVSFFADGMSMTYFDHESCDLILLSDLKRLVESHELLQSYGSLDDAKKSLSKKSMLRWIDPETELLRQAIADVESCHELN